MEIKEGEVICNKCNGTGTNHSSHGFFPCTKCLGSKKLTWTEFIMGRKPPLNTFNTYSTNSAIYYGSQPINLTSSSNYATSYCNGISSQASKKYSLITSLNDKEKDI